MLRYAALIVVALAAVPANAEPRAKTINQLYLDCRMGDSLPRTDESEVYRLRCESYFEGFIQTWVIARDAYGQNMGICPPRMVSVSELWQILRRYTEMQLDAVSLKPAAAVMHQAFAAAMPCPEPAAPAPAAPKRGF